MLTTQNTQKNTNEAQNPSGLLILNDYRGRNTNVYLWLMGAVIVTLMLLLTYRLGLKQGEVRKQQEWDAVTLVQQQQLLEKNNEAALKTARLEDAVKSTESELIKLKESHAKTIDSINRNYADRLRAADARSNRYKQMSRGTEAERNYLAKHATELDRTIEEGRHLVRELRETLGLREDELRRLGVYLETGASVLGSPAANNVQKSFNFQGTNQ